MKTQLVRTAQAGDLAQIAALLSRGQALPLAPGETLLVAQAAAAEGGPLALLGTIRLRPAIGLTLPRVWYHVGCTVHAASELKLFHRQRTLLLGHDHTGASELADIAWLREDVALADQAATLRLLVQTALLLMARARGHYAERLVAELPGPRDGAGQSPFWHGLGRHFYAGDPQAAAATHGPAWRSHVAALLPRQPICTSFLPAAAEAAIAHTHPDALLLREVLEEAGLRYSHHVNVEDAGPVLEAQTDELAAARRGRAWEVAAGDGRVAHVVLTEAPHGEVRALRALATVGGGRLALDAEARDALVVAPGDTVWALALGDGAD